MCPLARMSSINRASSSRGRPRSLHPTWPIPVPATDSYTSRASAIVRSSRVNMKMNSATENPKLSDNFDNIASAGANSNRGSRRQECRGEWDGPGENDSRSATGRPPPTRQRVMGEGCDICGTDVHAFNNGHVLFFGGLPKGTTHIRFPQTSCTIRRFGCTAPTRRTTVTSCTRSTCSLPTSAVCDASSPTWSTSMGRQRRLLGSGPAGC